MNIAKSASTPPANQPEKKALAVNLTEKFSRNGGQLETYLWSQTRDQVFISVFVPKGTRAKDINVTAKRQHVTVKERPSSKLIFDVDLAHPIDDSEEALVSTKKFRPRRILLHL